MLLINIDGSLTTTRSGEAYSQHPHDYEVIPQAESALQHFRKNNPYAPIVGISDQTAVEAGYKTFDNCVMEQRWKLLIIRDLNSILFCPNPREVWIVRRALEAFPLHTSQHGLPFIGQFQIPAPGLIQTALRYWGAPPEEATAIADRREVADAALAAGVPFSFARGRAA